MVACGGGERQDEDEPEGSFRVEVVKAEFPIRQQLAETESLRLAVENTGERSIPDLAVTIWVSDPDDPEGAKADGSFSVRDEQPDLADPNRPVWILESDYPKLAGETAPSGAAVAQTNTFAFGELEPDRGLDAIWRVTPVRGGTYTVNYRVAAGVEGKAKAVTEDGSPASGKFVVTIADKPPKSRVDDEGNVVREGGSESGSNG